MDIDYDNLGDSIEQDELELFENDTELNEGDLVDLEGSEELLSVQGESETDENLLMYIQSLEDKLKEGKIDDYTFSLDKLLVLYKRALIHKRFNITDDIDRQKIERTKELRKELENEFINDKINDIDYTRKYYNLLKLEYDLLMKYEDFTFNKKIKAELPKNFDKNIDDLIKSEQQYLKNIAKERNIYWPEKPKIDKKKDISKVKLQKYLTYYLELEKASEIAKRYIPGYKLRTIESVTKLDKDLKWTIDYPNILKYEELYQEYIEDKKEQSVNKIYDPTEKAYLNQLRTILTGKSKEELLTCIENAEVINKLSYIETLKLNKIPVMQFREYPSTFEKLQEILKEEANYYRITEKDLYKDFNTNFYNVAPNIQLKNVPSTFKPVYFVKTKDVIHETELPDFFEDGRKQYDIKPSDKGYSFLLKINEISLSTRKKQKMYNEYAEKGSVASISLKPKYFKSDKVLAGVIDETFYNIIKPLDDKLYQELKSKQLPANKTDLIEVYELHVPVPELSKSDSTNPVKLVRRYTEFNGLNKPKNLYVSNDEKIGKDGKLRASYRHIFLTLRNSKGNFNNINKIMKLVIHEIAHTMCNHVTWRDDDHADDFEHSEKLITDAYIKIINQSF